MDTQEGEKERERVRIRHRGITGSAELIARRIKGPAEAGLA